MNPEARILDHLSSLYGDEHCKKMWPILEACLARFKQKHPQLQTAPPLEEIINERAVVLITYGDQIQEKNQPPLKTLQHFIETNLDDLISGVHVLPFFPYSSDDGFAVIDYTQVDPNLGTWEDIARLSQGRGLMVDAVINHISSQSKWFQGYLLSEQPYDDYFITVAPDSDLSQVVRPRALPLLTAVNTRLGQRHVWTTFSEDQIDLDFSNPQVLLEIIGVLLLYVERGASFIRLDAIAYLWKQLGTSCIHLPQTHRVIKLLRAVLDDVAPGVILISETNVPHEENIRYFGKPVLDVGGDEATQRGDEAQMVYQFPLAPLVLHTFLSGNARPLTEWAAGLSTPYQTATFFNFIASHDGIGVRPAEGLLSPQEIQALVDATLAHGGQVSYKTNSDGSQSAYELNITLYDALNDPHNPQDDLDVKRFLASQAIMLSLSGVPGIYFHSLFGLRNDLEGLAATGRARSINRQKIQLESLEATRNDGTNIARRVFGGYAQMLEIRREQAAFHPLGGQEVLSFHPKVVAILRTVRDEGEQTLCLINVSELDQMFVIPNNDKLISVRHFSYDLLSSESWSQAREWSLAPYQVRWIRLGDSE
jgi:glucosylglycerate phosphorylase